MTVLDQIQKLHLDNLEDEWVQTIYDSEFLEFGDLPPEYESATDCSAVDVRTTFQNIMNAIDDCCASSEDVSWANLSREIKHQHLLALIGYYIDYGNKHILTTEYRNNALWASRLYYKLLTVPGHKTYNVYHSQLFAHSLGCLNFPKIVCENEDNYFNPKRLSKEVNSIIKDLGDFVFDLKIVIEKLHLNPNDLNFEDILRSLVEITGGAIVFRLNVDKVELANLSKVVYEVIDFLLCSPYGGPNPMAIKLLFKCLLHKLVASSIEYKQANNIVRASYVTYSGIILTKYGKIAVSSYVVMLQHLAYHLEGLEKAEVRSARISLIVGLISLLPQRSFRSIVKWMLTLSNTAKVPHRQIALEVLLKLLSNDPEDESNSGNESPRKISTDTIGSDERSAQSEDNTDSGLENSSKSTIPDSESESQDIMLPLPLDNDGDEDVSNILQHRRHCVQHTVIVKAIYERVNDVSSTLRARALNILTELLDTTHPPIQKAIIDISGDGEACLISSAASRCAADERAVVRKAAVVVIHQLLLRNPHQSHCRTLVSLCRDASIIVRGAAINALSDVAVQKPSEITINAFLAGPFHQLSDPETKIQTQVTSSVQSLLVTPMIKYDKNAQEDPRPWLFLGAIVQRNMRKHLQKACMLLSKTTNCINHRLVDLVSTHLGAFDDDRDMQSLVLLTSVARLLDYTEISFMLDYYYSLANDQKKRDNRLMPLTLEAISLWSRHATEQERSGLRDHLIAKLSSELHNDCRTACASLAANLEPNNLQWATDLMKLSESRALNGGCIDEWVRAADMSLVAPEPPSRALLDLYLTALDQPPDDWSGAKLGVCVASAGRLCLRARAAAVLVAPRLAELLRHESSRARDARDMLPARLNALLALTDICTRYSCIVDPLLESMCGCLNKEAPRELRRAAARALTRLLLAGFLRLNTPLYYRYCALLADEDLEVREPAEYFVTSCLSLDVIYHHFVDCVLNYNRDGNGGLSFDERQLIYDVMLQRMSPVQRLNVQCRLGREVVQHAADVADELTAQDELPPALHAALLDTATLLCGPRMKPPKRTEKQGDADIDDLQERVTSNIVSHKMKRTVAEVLVPAVLRVDAVLRTRGGQLATYMVRLATDLYNEYRQEIEELIENDEDLMERVRHFQETIGLDPNSGNARNLVTSNAPPDPETPRAPRKRPGRAGHNQPARKRTLKIL